MRRTGSWRGSLSTALSLDVETVIPGHGPPTNLTEVARFRELLVSLRERVGRAIRAASRFAWKTGFAPKPRAFSSCLIGSIEDRQTELDQCRKSKLCFCRPSGRPEASAQTVRSMLYPVALLRAIRIEDQSLRYLHFCSTPTPPMLAVRLGKPVGDVCHKGLSREVSCFVSS
ncbi:hypothetical protein GGC47_004182 [Bosea sp. OAE752]|jgi:hypothetical protein|uniref:hypothetical protein n=1 Tax=unclassified Bosea (in: a-proteobacteria) TaxID=2653178 RepID=UPI0011525161